MKARTKDKLFPYLMLLPSMVGLAVLVLYPVVRGLFLSLYEYTLLYPSYPFIGLGNYKELFTKDDIFWGTLGNTVWYTIGNGVGSTIIAIWVALVLNRAGRIQAFLRGFVLLPWLVPSVVISTIWIWMYSPDFSPINDLLLRIGLISQPIRFLGNVDFRIGPITLPFLSILVVRMWFSFSYKAVIILAALVNIPRERYEAADIDGAGAWAQFVHVTLPGIYPQLMIVLTLTLIGNFGYFDINYLMTRGGPANYTNVMAVQMYLMAFEHFRLGYAAAMGIVMLLFTSVIAIAYVVFVVKRDLEGDLMAGMRRDPVPLQILTWILIAVLLVWVGFPFYWLFVSSIKTPLEVSQAPPTYWPKAPVFSNYVNIWTEVKFLQALYNSFFITVVTVLVSLALTTTTGYALSRFDFKGKDFVVGLLLFVQLVPLAIYLIPLYFTLLSLKLINKYLGLIICYGIIGIPFMALIMRSYFKNAYPAELEEAAIIDGCSRFGTFVRIGLPLTRTGMIAVGTMTAINTWKEFLFASIVINKGRMRPVAVVIFDLVGEMGLAFTRMGLFMSACVLVMVPLIVMFLFVQRLIVEGLTAGSVKS